MGVRYLIAVLALCLAAGAAAADERQVRLFAPGELVATGLLQYALPRFSLKTQVRVEVVDDPAAADIVLGAEGRALFEGAGAVWHADVSSEGGPGAARLMDWLTSEVGLRTVTTFAPAGAPLFRPPSARPVAVARVGRDGDAVRGHAVSRAQCARCHAVDEASRRSTIGSTPSFHVLRSLGDWEARFAAFYALNPHPAFTQVEGVTAPFANDRPPPIVPLALTLGDLEAVMAYVAGLAPADLGAPLGTSPDF